MKIITLYIAWLIGFSCFNDLKAQNIQEVIDKVKNKLGKVNDYVAEGKMETHVSFLKIPPTGVKIFFKQPGSLKLKTEKGISFLPKGAVSLNIGSILNGNKYTVIDGGTTTISGTVVRIAKLLPEDEDNPVILSILYIDELNSLVKRAKTTTRENGTYELDLTYGAYSNFALPDKILFSFDAGEYKLPKGMTFDFDDGASSKNEKKVPKKGSAEISINNYLINKGLDDSIFK